MNRYTELQLKLVFFNVILCKSIGVIDDTQYDFGSVRCACTVNVLSVAESDPYLMSNTCSYLATSWENGCCC